MYKYSKSLNTTVSNSQAQDVEEKKKEFKFNIKKIHRSRTGKSESYNQF